MAKTKTTEPEQKLSYFERRMKLLGVTPEINKISLHGTELQTGKDIMRDVAIFQEVPEGIKILVYTLDRLTIRIEKNGSRMKEDFALTRLENPIVKGNDVMKYRIPKGGGTYPFFPPALIDKYEKKIPMKTVFLTEGYFKAFKGSMLGIDIIGLSSITHMKDKETGGLHSDIMKLIKSGLVERFVWLTDGDCLDITSKEITEEKDLYTRPKGFFSSVQTFRQLLDDFEHIEKWFMHVDTEAIWQSNKAAASKKDGSFTRDDVKGLDDLLVTFNDRADEIVHDLTSVSNNGFYFQKFNISHGTHKVWRHFHIADVNDFFLFHVDRRPELKSKEFKFFGTRYKWDDEKQMCEVRMPGEANLYFRVGDDYYKWIEKPNQHNQIEKVITERKKSTLSDDHGKAFYKHVPKYEAFCNVPDHNNFKQVIHNCFNVYSPIDHVPDEDECTPEDFPQVMNLIGHIFGDKTVSYKEKDTGEKKEYRSWELGLDYLQLLYQQPAKKLPILCLVSKENGTGKSTLGFFLRSMLGANVAIVGNSDLANDFNAHWATKSVVICDEAKIDKHQVIEKIKALSTAKKIFMNAKGRGQVELDCFIKFILMTNNEENFIYASEEDERYWVIKVPVLRSDDPHILDKLVDEIPAFLSFLNKRKMATEEKSRMWFHSGLLKTDALRKVIAYSMPTIEKEIRQYFKELFMDTGLTEIRMALKDVHKEIFNNKFEKNYLASVLQDRIKVKHYHVWVVDDVDKEYNTQVEALAAAEVKYPDHKGHMIFGKIQTKEKVVRYSYPKFDEVIKDNKRSVERVEISNNGRPFCFFRDQFVTEAENDSVIISAEHKFLNSTVSENGHLVSDGFKEHDSAGEELPFGN